MSGERGLWVAVLIQAIEDLRGDGFVGRYLQAEARRWFESHEERSGSFVWICDHTDLDADALRRRVLSGRLWRAPKKWGCYGMDSAEIVAPGANASEVFDDFPSENGKGGRSPLFLDR